MVSSSKHFGRLQDGTPVALFTLRNAHGMEVDITDLGGIVVAWRVPAARGVMRDIVVGCERLEDFLAGHPYFGALVGRCANRIAKGRFVLDGEHYRLACNNGPNHLHGGNRGFDAALWRAEASADALSLHTRSRDGEEGYPGNLDVTVTYSLDATGALRIDYRARTDRPTIVNLSNHLYFNLGDSPTVLDHLLQITADTYTPTDASQIPTGELAPVAGTAFDFRQPRRIGAQIARAATMQGDDAVQLRIAGGFDHNFMLGGDRREAAAGELPLAARLTAPDSGCVLEVFTDRPALQVYAGNFLDGTHRGKRGAPIGRHAGLCLETQLPPDAVNQPGFPSPVLRPGETFTTATIYRVTSPEHPFPQDHVVTATDHI